MTCLLPLSLIYTVTPFSTAKDFKSHLDSQDDSPPFYQLQHEEHALAFGSNKERSVLYYLLPKA